MKTPSGLQPLIDDGVIDQVMRPLKSGKEAAVYVVRAGGDIVPHLQLARAGWPAESDPDLLWLKPHLARLRSKVQAAGGPQVVAVRGVGYRILDEA